MAQQLDTALRLVDELGERIPDLWDDEVLEHAATAGGRSGRGTPRDLIRTSVLDARAYTVRSLSLNVALTRAVLGDGRAVLEITAVSCPVCRAAALLWDTITGQVRCADPDCRDADGHRPTWPQAWLHSLGRDLDADAGGQPVSILDRLRRENERLREAVARIQAENGRLAGLLAAAGIPVQTGLA